MTLLGLNASAHFFATVFSATVLSILLVGIFARVVWKMNFIDLSSLLAGSMTDPTALDFASNIAGSYAPSRWLNPMMCVFRVLRCFRSQRNGAVVRGKRARNAS